MGKAAEILNRRKKYGATYVDAEYDTTKSSRSASEILKNRRINEYREELNSFDIKPLYDYKDFGLSEDKKREYKTTLSNYKTALENLKKYDSSIKEEDYNDYLQSIDSLASKFDVLSYYKTEDEYNAALNHNSYKDYSYYDIQKEISDIEYKRSQTTDKAEADKLGKTLDWLKAYLPEVNTTKEYDLETMKKNERAAYDIRKEKNLFQNKLYSDAIDEGKSEAEAKRIATSAPELDDYNARLMALGFFSDDIDGELSKAKLQKYKPLEKEAMAMPDFDAKSAYAPSAPKTDAELKAEGYKLDANGEWYKEWGFGNVEYYSGEDDELYTYINDPDSRMSIEVGNTYNNVNYYADNGFNQLNEDEIGVYNALYSTDKNKANEYIELLKPTLQNRAMQKEAERYAEAAEAIPVIMSAMSVGTNFQNALMFPAKALATATGIYDENPWLDTYGNRTNAIRGTISQNLDENVGHLASMAYSGVMSMADMGIALAAGGGNGKIVQAIMSSSAGSSSLSNAKNSGRSDGEALIFGLGSAAIEWATEKYSVEKLLNDPTSIKSYLWQNFSTEALEEGASNIGNIALDGLVSYITNSKSEIEATIDDLVLNGGLSKYEAGKKVFLQKANEFFEDMAVGGFTGLGMAGITLGTGAVGVAMEDAERTKQAGIDITDNKRVGELAALATNTGNAKLKKFAEEVAGVKNYEDLSTSQKNAYTKKVSKLYKQTLSAQKKKSKTVSADTLKGIVSKKLEENGVDASKIDKAADAIVKFKLNSGKALSEAEKKIFDEVDGATIFNEIKKSQEEIDTAIEKAEDDLFGDRVKTAFLTDKVESPLSNSIRKEVTTDGLISDSGKTTRTSTGDEIVIDKDNPIASIKTVNGERKAFFNTNQGVVESSDISYANETEALIHESFLDMHPSIVSTAIKSYDGKIPVQTYIDGMREGILLYGKHNFQEVGKDISIHSDFAQLSKADQALALKLGRAVKNIETTNANKAIATAKEKARKSGLGKRSITKGEVRFENGAKVETRSEKRAVALAKHLASAIGIDIVFYDAKTTKNKDAATANGYFDPNTDTIYLDLRKSVNESKTIAFTMSHELVHFVKKYSPAKFQVFADFLMQEFAVQGVSTSTLLANKMAELKTDDADLAYEEMVADACERMLLDSDVMLKLAKLKKIDLDLFEKIRLHIISLLNKIREEYKQMNYAPQSDEAKALKLTEELLEKFEEMVVDATENFQMIGSKNLSDYSEAKTTDGKPLFQYKAIKADEREYRVMLRNHTDMTDTEINNLFTTIDKAVDIIKNNLEILDYAWEEDIDDRAFNPVKPNSDSLYKFSVDFSTMCRKRILQQVIIEELQRALDRAVTKAESIAIRNELMKLQEEGRQIEIACALCYVESARMKSPAQIQKFLDDRGDIVRKYFASKSEGEIKAKIAEAEASTRQKLAKQYVEEIAKGDMPDPTEMVGKKTKKFVSLKSLPQKMANEIRDVKRAVIDGYKPNANEEKLIKIAENLSVEDFTSAKGLENLAKNHAEIFDAYTSYVRNATKSKGTEKDVWWRIGDSQKLTDDLIATMNAENGLRTQSWSDFQVMHLLDYIGAIIELSARKAKMQAYTKVPDYVHLMGNTNQMINLSLIPTAVFDGKLDFDSVEGMAFKKALELRDKYPATAGTISIGINNEQIRMLLESALIDYVIPYHQSGMSKVVRKEMHIPTWESYESYQSEKNLKYEDAKQNAQAYGVKLLSNKDPMWHKHPNFSEWFDIDEARQIAEMENHTPTDTAMQKKFGVMYGAYKAMQNAANNYLKVCAERGLSPKFSHESADFTKEANYWKLLIDRKMINNITGEIIEQKPVQAVFDESEVLRILNDEVARYPKVKEDQDYATRAVVGKFLSGDMNEDISKVAAGILEKPVNNITKVSILNSVEETKSAVKKQAKNNKSEFNIYNDPLYPTSARSAEYLKELGYDGIIDYEVASRFGHFQDLNEDAVHYVVFDSNQIKLTTNLNPTKDNDIRYQKKRPTNRELLSNALESTIDTSTQEGKNELDTLKKYKGDISKIEELETHLTEVKSEIYRLSFSKGNKDMTRIRELREDKIKTENRLNVLDKKILRVEATKPIRDILAREKEKVRRNEKEKAKEALDKFKEKSNAALKEVMKHNQESRQKNVEGRHKTEMRKKIKGVVNDLDKMLKAGRKKANVKVGMRDAVEQALATAELLFSSNITNEDIVRNGVSATTSAESIKLNRYMDLLAKREHYVDTIEAMVKVSPNANTDGQYQMIDAIDREIGTLNKELSDVFERERNRLNEVVISSAIQDLADTYKAIGESEYSYISGAYNEFVYKRLLALKESIGGTTIRDMSMYQLQEVYDAYKMVLHVVRTANTLFKEGKSVDAIAGAVIDEVNAVAKARMRSVAAEKLNSFLWAEMKPRTAFEKIGSDTLLGLYDNLRKGEDTFAMDVYDAFKFAESIREKYNFKKWDMKSRIDFKLDNGKTFSINLQQLMSIYAYSKREQALKHMTEGGFVLDSKETFKKDKKGIFEMIPTAETYRLSANDITRLIDTLTNEYGSVKNYVDEMQKYLTDMGEKGNEVSRIVFGIDLFKEKVYFPLKSSHDYIQSNNDALDKNNAQKSLISSGMTKETVPNARNPIVLSSFDSVWASHTNQMSLYHSFVPALEDFRKVYQYSSSAEGVDDASVRAEIRKVFGDNAVNYISKLLDDINGGMPTNEANNPIMSLFGTFKKTAVGMSLSTVIQQPTAIIRAWSILNPKYFVGVPHNNFSSEQWEEIKKYAPIAILKEIGGFDAGSGRGMVDYLSGDVNKNTLKKVSGKIDDVSMWLAGEGDVLGWGMIWNAVKREVKETTNLTEGTEEFLTKCGERFTEVITETQVYDSTFSRSGIMRSKNELNKFATSFMAEPTTSINMLYRAVINAKRGKISKRKATATIGSVVASQFVASALVSLIYAARDDDDDETYAEKYAESFGGRMINATPIGLLNMLPYLRDIQSIFDGWDVERPDMAIFADIKNAFDGFASKSKTPYMKWRDFITAITNAFGVPLGNAERDLRAIFYNIPKMIFDDVTPTWDNTLEAFGDGFTGKDTSKKDRAWNAYKKGDTSKVKETVNDLIDDKVKSGKTAKEAKSTVRSSFTSTYKKEYLEAVENKDYNLMNEIRKFLHATGLYGTLTELDKDLKAWRED